MQIGVCLNMAARDPQKLGMDLLPDIARCGYNFIEVSVSSVMQLERDAFLQRVEKRVRESGLPCLAMNAFCGADQSFWGEAGQQKALDYTKEALERAARLGARTIVVGAGLARSVPPHITREDAKKQMASFFAQIGELAQPFGIRFALEGLNKSESNLYTDMEQVVDQTRCTAHKNVGALVDYYHFSLGNEDPEKLVAYAPQILHAHFARVLCRVFPKSAAEDAGYLPFLRALQRGGYQGALSLEAYCPDDFAPSAKQALCLLRALCGEAGL